MSRRLRLYVPGGFFHVMLRGVDREGVFRDGADRAQFCFYLKEALQRFELRLHAFCLMTTHVHLVLQQSTAGLGKMVHHFAFRYARWFNDRWGRRGHLFGDRFKGLLVQEDNYLLELVRYVHLNPVRAGMVERPEDHAWSSCRHYLGLEMIPWVTSETVLRYFGNTTDEARRRLSAFVLAGIDEEPRCELEQGCSEDFPIIGDGDFIEKVVDTMRGNDSSRGAALPEFLEIVTADFGVTMLDLASPARTKRLREARSVLALLVREQGGASLSELGRALGRDSSTMSATAERASTRRLRDQAFALRVSALGRKVTRKSSC